MFQVLFGNGRCIAAPELMKGYVNFLFLLKAARVECGYGFEKVPV